MRKALKTSVIYVESRFCYFPDSNGLKNNCVFILNINISVEFHNQYFPKKLF